MRLSPANVYLRVWSKGRGEGTENQTNCYRDATTEGERSTRIVSHLKTRLARESARVAESGEVFSSNRCGANAGHISVSRRGRTIAFVFANPQSPPTEMRGRVSKPRCPSMGSPFAESTGRANAFLNLSRMPGGVSGAAPYRPASNSRCFMMVGRRSKRAGPTLLEKGDGSGSTGLPRRQPNNEALRSAKQPRDQHDGSHQCKHAAKASPIGGEQPAVLATDLVPFPPRTARMTTVPSVD